MLLPGSPASPNTDTFYKGPKTARETSFAQVYGRDLHEAYEACRRYRSYGEARDLERAWEIYYGVSLCMPCYLTGFLYLILHSQVFKRIEKSLPQLTTLDLQYISPELLKARNLELAVPGKIFSFSIPLNISLRLSQAPMRVESRS